MSHRDRVAAARAYTRGNLLYRDYERTGDLQVLQAAIGLLGEAVAAVPAGDPDRPGYLSDLGIALQDRYERTGRQADLEQAVSWLSAAVDTAPAGDPDLHRYLSNLGNALRAQFGRTGQLAVLARAIAVGRRAVDAAPARHPSRHMYLFNLGIALRAQFRYAGREPDLDQAIELIRAAVRAAGGGHPDRPAMLSSLGNALQDRFERTGQRADLDEAVAVGQQAADAVPAGSPGRADFLSNLGNALHARFEHTGRLTDLDQAISVGQQAVDAAPAGHIHRPAMLSNLAGALAARFRRTGRLADIGRSITVGRLAVEGTPAGSPALPMYLSNLGTAFQYRFSRTGQFSDLDEAIAAGQQALAAAPADHASRPLFLTNLGNALQVRFARTGQLTDLNAAVARLTEAVTAAGPGHPSRPLYLSNLGNILQVRFARTGQLADLDAAVARLTEAVGASPAGHPGRAAYLSNRGLALLARFLRTGQEADLDEAVTSGRLAVEAIPQGDADQPVHRANLGAALLVRASAGQPADLDEAVTLLTAAAAASPADHPDRALYLTRLGLARRARFDGAGQRADLDAALDAFREAAGIATASPGRRVAAAREWGHCALLHGRPDDALAGYALAVELLPLVAWHGLDQPTREHHLQEWAGLACDAAAAAVAAGQADRAVELLEAGRSVLWTQAARLRQDLAALRIANAGLAAALEASRAILDIAAAGLTSDPVPEDEQQVLARRRQAARDWDDAVDRVRGIDGFRDFLRPTRYADLRAAAVKGAVVIVNVSRHGSHALIVPPPAGPGPDHAVVVAGLPDAPRDIVVQQANILLRAQRRAESPATDPRAGPDDRRAVLDVLDWSWRAIAGPALAALGHTGTPPGRTEDWPRLWWCPTGPATLLPLHAAGRHPGSGSEHDAPGEAAAVSETVAGRVISSYAPTLTVLAQARSRSGPGPVRQLAVGVSEAPGYAAGAGPLPEVPAELRTVGRYVTAPDFATRLLDGAATRQAVLAALPGHSWLHMSCHGFQDRASPSRSAFFLHDQPLTLADLAGLSLGQTDLAYLAACQTAAGDLRLPDEALHLAGALQLAGYRHVLATLWSISDFTAAEMAGIIYAHLAHPDPDHPGESDRPLADRAPYALHHAVSWLRRAHAGDPLRWAPYVHLGP